MGDIIHDNGMTQHKVIQHSTKPKMDKVHLIVYLKQHR